MNRFELASQARALSPKSLLFALLATASTAAGCDLQLIDEHLPAAQDDFFPVRHVAAVSDNHEHVFIASALTGGLRLVSSNGNLTDELVLNNTWQPVAAATYYGADFDYAGIGQHNEAGLVLHANGTILPWFHHGGQLRYHWAGRIQAPHWPAVGDVHYIDVDQGNDGTVYILAEERAPGQPPSTVIAYRTFDENGNAIGGGSIVGQEKAVALAYDQHAGTLTVAYAQTNARDVTLEEYDENLNLTRTRTLDDLREISDLEVLGGWHYMGVLSCDNATCTESVREFQLRDPNLDIDDALPVAAEGVALDLPPFPLNAQSNVDVWRVGRDEWQLAEYDVVTP